MRKDTKMFLVASVLSANICTAQTVISSAGAIDKTNTITIEWTLGETSVESAVSGLIYEGYHQPVLKVTPSEKDPSDSEDRFVIAPNPVSSFLNFKSFSVENADIKILLTDLTGKFISLTNATTNDSKNIEMSQLKSGTYLLMVKDSKGNVIKTFNVIKTH